MPRRSVLTVTQLETPRASVAILVAGEFENPPLLRVTGLFEAACCKFGIVNFGIMLLQDMPDVFSYILELEGKE